jgi:hypothetical protein
MALFGPSGANQMDGSHFLFSPRRLVRLQPTDMSVGKRGPGLRAWNWPPWAPTFAGTAEKGAATKR